MLKSMSLHSSSGTRRYMCVEVQSCALTPATYSYTPEAAGCPRLQKALVNPRRPHTIMLPQMPRQQHLQRQRSDKQSADCPDGSLCHIRGCKSLHRGWPQRRSSARPPQHLRARSSSRQKETLAVSPQCQLGVSTYTKCRNMYYTPACPPRSQLGRRCPERPARWRCGRSPAAS